MRVFSCIRRSAAVVCSIVGLRVVRVQSCGPGWTIDGTVFEMWLVSLCPPGRYLAIVVRRGRGTPGFEECLSLGVLPYLSLALLHPVADALPVEDAGGFLASSHSFRRCPFRPLVHIWSDPPGMVRARPRVARVFRSQTPGDGWSRVTAPPIPAGGHCPQSHRPPGRSVPEPSTAQTTSSCFVPMPSLSCIR